MSSIISPLRYLSLSCLAFLGALLLGGCSGLEAEPLPATVVATVEELQKRALESDQAYAFLESLTVEVGHRFAGSANDARAVAWARQQLETLGFANVRTEEVTVPRWIRGTAHGEILAPFPQPVELIALGGSVGTDGALEAEVVEVASLEALDGLERQQVEGNIVFFNRRMRRTRDGSGYGEAVGVRVGGPSRAAALGARAVLIRSIGTDNDRIGHTGSLRYSDDAPRIAAAALSNPDADMLEKQLARGTVRFRLELTSRIDPQPAQSANVIGEILGREHPEEIVLLVAHLDSWDAGTGAHDNGAGCAIITAAARLIGALETPPRRTVRVLLTANEEFGLSGARAYAERYKEAFASHVVGVESDFGAGRVYAFRAKVEDRARPWVKAWAELLAPLDIAYQDDPARGGADLSVTAPFRLPIFDLRQDGTHYFDIHHTINDTLDKIDPEALKHNVAAFATIAYLAAESTEDLGRAPETPAAP